MKHHSRVLVVIEETNLILSKIRLGFRKGRAAKCRKLGERFVLKRFETFLLKIAMRCHLLGLGSCAAENCLLECSYGLS
jgi:hypothetical protein